jgi:hypothetical protein
VKNYFHRVLFAAPSLAKLFRCREPQCKYRHAFESASKFDLEFDFEFDFELDVELDFQFALEFDFELDFEFAFEFDRHPELRGTCFFRRALFSAS